jgi:hypothetical protein
MGREVIMLNNINSSVITALRESLVYAGIITRTAEGAYICDTIPALHAAPPDVLHHLQSIVNGDKRVVARIVGTHVSVGTTDDGMHEHRDESYQNYIKSDNELDDTSTLLVYLTDVEEGGETVFVSDDNLVEMRVKPRVGNAVMFSSRTLHHTLPVKRGHKIVIAAECVQKTRLEKMV